MHAYRAIISCVRVSTVVEGMGADSFELVALGNKVGVHDSLVDQGSDVGFRDVASRLHKAI
jgi:hypothetical protein